MKRNGKRWIAAALLLVAVLGACWYLLYEARPLRTLDAGEIREIRVRAMPPDREAVLSKAEVDAMLPLLRELKVTRPGYRMPPVSGQTVFVTVRKDDGSMIEITNVGNMQLVIDGKRYRAEYDSVDAMDQLVNRVLETGF